MRMKLVAALVAALAVAGAAVAQEGVFQRDHGKLAPPALLDTPAVAAPPEGAGPGGLDFGQWRSFNPNTYSNAFQANVRARLSGKPVSAARMDLAANGFACQTPGDRNGLGPPLECRLAAEEKGCDYEWWVVVEDPAMAPQAGRDVMCVGR